MNILILGGAGFLGSHLAGKCSLLPDSKIRVIDNFDPKIGSTETLLKNIAPHATIIQGDVLDENLLSKEVSWADWIFACAAQTSHSLSMQDPLRDLDQNVKATLLLLETIRSKNPKAKVLYPATTTSFGKATQAVIAENHLENPLELYSAHKGLSAKYFQIYAKYYDLNCISLQFANIFGPGGKNSAAFGFMNYFINQIWSNQSITVFEPGDQIRNVLFVEDAAEVMIAAMGSSQLVGKNLLATGDEHFTVKEIAHSIQTELNRGKVIMSEWPKDRKKIEVDSVRFDNSNLKHILKWKPSTSFKAGLKRTRESLQKWESKK